MAEKRPTIPELHQALKDLKQWETFGISLKCMRFPIIEEIKLDENTTEKRKLELYNKWLNVCPDATWDDVATALEETENVVLAKEVRKNISRLKMSRE